MSNKVKHGQFFTKNNPFSKSAAWKNWYKNVGKYRKSPILEPFAGDKDISKHLKNFDFDFYDIEPKHGDIKFNDSLKNFPKGYNICISNPPYLGKSSAKRIGIEYNYELPDLYLVSIEQILKNVDYACLIIPAAFLSNKFFKERLAHVDIITKPLFEDTDIPVIVAYFNKVESDTYKVYKDGKFLGIKKDVVLPMNNFSDVKFNCDDGQLGLHAIDGTTGSRIRFCKASEIKRVVKNSDRAITKICVNFEVTDDVINKLNQILEEYRSKTFDLTLTSFRGIQDNGEHRKRLSYSIAKEIIGALNV